MNCVTRRGAS